ncbi:MAG: recombinase zinc beta ribbon domain-containing protein [Verrucomicrobiota bacterium]
MHNPRYAGAFCFGRTRSWKGVDGKYHVKELPREEWRFLKKDAHPGYISWDQFLANQQRLIQNHQTLRNGEHNAGPPREGSALLQGIVICGKCGRAMTIKYHHRGGRLTPDYICQKDCVEQTEPACQRIPGGGIDEAIGQLLVQSVTPLALEVALGVQSEIQARLAEADRLRQRQVQRAQYEADQARVRYMRVDPNNRLVADTLEVQWNEKLRLLAQAKEECEKQHRLDSAQITDEQKAKILALASDFPKLWQDPKTQDRDRKRMARLLLEDVTLRRGDNILAQVRFKGGAMRELHLPLPKSAWALRKTKPEIVAEIDRLLSEHCELEVARSLNERGWRSSSGCEFTLRMISQLRFSYSLKPRRERLREQGWLTVHEVAALLKCPSARVDHWRSAGLLEGIRYSTQYHRLYRKPSAAVITEIRRRCHNDYSTTQNPQQSA